MDEMIEENFIQDAEWHPDERIEDVVDVILLTGMAGKSVAEILDELAWDQLYIYRVRTRARPAYWGTLFEALFGGGIELTPTSGAGMREWVRAELARAEQRNEIPEGTTVTAVAEDWSVSSMVRLMK